MKNLGLQSDVVASQKVDDDIQGPDCDSKREASPSGVTSERFIKEGTNGL